MKKVSTKLYAFTLAATAAVFILAIAVSAYITNRKTAELKGEEDTVAINILSLENQADILTNQIGNGKNAESSAVSATSTAAEIGVELSTLESRLSFMEDQVGANDPAIYQLKRYYALLEIKDYLLEQALAKNAVAGANSAHRDTNGSASVATSSAPLFIMYFYGGAGQTCSQCLTQQYILQAVQEDYPNAHIYSFDDTVDLAAVESFIPLKGVPANPPVVVINSVAYPGFASLSLAQAAIQKALNIDNIN